MLDAIASSPFARMLVLIMVFASVALTSVLLLTTLDRRMTIRGKMKALATPLAAFNDQPDLQKRSNSAWTRIVERIENAGLNLDDTKADALRERLRAAGFDSPLAPRLFNLLRLVLVLALPTIFVVLSLLGGNQISIGKLYLVCSLCALAGVYVPALVVRARADRRREAIIHGFPDCLDLMLICVEAGLGLEAALDRVAHEMALSHPLVAQLLATANLRLRAGATREEALRKMADDAAVDEIRSFATLLIQSDRLGSSIGATLRIYAGEMRERRRMRAEEKAHRLPVLLSIPLVACMLPTMIGVLMLPAIIRVVRNLLPAMGG
ncbi:MAG: type II secretion system F family protein [Sphingomonadaceae bacterium]